MKKNLLALLIVAVFALVISIGFTGCKKEEVPADVSAIEELVEEAVDSEEAAE